MTFEQVQQRIQADAECVPAFWREKYEADAARNWDIFYSINSRNFFKVAPSPHNSKLKMCYACRRTAATSTWSSRSCGRAARRWRRSTCSYASIRRTFATFSTNVQTLISERAPQGNRTVLLEVGCGTGNTVFPLLSANCDLFVHCCDFAASAVELVKSNAEFSEERCHAFQADVTQETCFSSIPGHTPSPCPAPPITRCCR